MRSQREITQIHKKLTGCTILGPIYNDDGSFGFSCKNPKTSKTLLVWVDCDPEGNGPGHLQIQEE